MGGYFGDGDPVDVVELSGENSSYRTGEVWDVKVLGAVGLIDQGELDWKIFAVRSGSDFAQSFEDIEDFKKKFPDRFASILSWFLTYKKFDGKKVANFYMNDSEVLGAKEAKKIIEKTHKMWQERGERWG